MDKIEGLGKRTNVPGGGAESAQPKLPDLPDLDVPEVPLVQAPDAPDLPDLPPVPNIPDAKIPGLDAMQKILDMISAKIEALRPPELPTLPSTIDLAGNLAGGALSAGFAAPPLTMEGQGTLGVTMNNDVSAGGGVSGNVGGGTVGGNIGGGNIGGSGGGGSGSGGGGSGSGGGGSGSGSSAIPGFREKSAQLRRREERQQQTLAPPQKSLLETIYDMNAERKMDKESEQKRNLYAMLELNSRIKMIPTSPEAKRLMNPKLTQGTERDPLYHPAYNEATQHPTGDRGTTEEVTGAELFPVTTMKVCANEQAYGVHLGLLRSIFKSLPNKQVKLECTPEFGNPKDEL